MCKRQCLLASLRGSGRGLGRTNALNRGGRSVNGVKTRVSQGTEGSTGQDCHPFFLTISWPPLDPVSTATIVRLDIGTAEHLDKKLTQPAPQPDVSKEPEFCVEENNPNHGQWRAFTFHPGGGCQGSTALAAFDCSFLNPLLLTGVP